MHDMLDHPDILLLMRLTDAAANGQGLQRGERFAYFIRDWVTDAERERLLQMRVRCPGGCEREMCPVTVLKSPLSTGRIRVPAQAMSVKFSCGYKAGGFSCARSAATRALIREFHRRLIGMAPAAIGDRQISLFT